MPMSMPISRLERERDSQHLCIECVEREVEKKTSDSIEWALNCNE